MSAAALTPADLFDDRPGILRMGLRPLRPDDWLIVDEHYERDVAHKAHLMAERPDRCFVALDGTDDAGDELLAETETFLARHHPGRRPPTTGGIHPVDAAGRLVQEDLCVHTERGGRLILSAASVCFPSRWDVRTKVGQPVSDVHGPVPGYQAALGKPVDAFLARIDEERVRYRLNWSLPADPAMHQPTDPTPTGVRRGWGPGQVATGLWLRAERQTFRRLPVTGAVVFGIRTFVWPLDVLATDPTSARRLAASVRAMSPAMARYKGVAEVRDSLLAWLDGVAAGEGMPVPAPDGLRVP